jgi:hypothetical protein
MRHGEPFCELTQLIIRYTGSDEGWSFVIDGQRITVEVFEDMQKAVDYIAEHNGWFTDYKEAKNFVARENA